MDIRDFLNEFESLFGDFGRGLNMKAGEESGVDSNGNWHRRTSVSSDGSIRIVSFVRSIEPNTKKKTVEQLKKEMEACVESQDFERAAQLRDIINAAENGKAEEESLRKELSRAVESQDFERAIEIRDRLKKFK